jgi:hypothetical protein
MAKVDVKSVVTCISSQTIANGSSLVALLAVFGGSLYIAFGMLPSKKRDRYLAFLFASAALMVEVLKAESLSFPGDKIAPEDRIPTLAEFAGALIVFLVTTRVALQEESKDCFEGKSASNPGRPEAPSRSRRRRR